MKKDKLHIPINRMPCWMIWAIFFTLGLAAHLMVGLWGGLRDGLDSFKCEWRMLLEDE